MFILFRCAKISDGEKCVFQVNACQNREHIGLDERYQNLERVNSRNGKPDSGAIAAIPANAAKTLITACPAIMLPANGSNGSRGAKIRDDFDQRQTGRNGKGAEEIQTATGTRHA